MEDDMPTKGKTCPMDFEGALAHGIAALNAVALASPGPRSKEWSEAACFLRLVLRALRKPNGREIPTRRPPIFG